MKRIKMIIAAALITLTAATMTACNAEIEETNSGKASAFVQVEKTDYWRIVYNRETKVTYVVMRGGTTGCFTILLNADGPTVTYRDGKDIPRVAP